MVATVTAANSRMRSISQLYFVAFVVSVPLVVPLPLVGVAGFVLLGSCYSLILARRPAPEMVPSDTPICPTWSSV